MDEVEKVLLNRFYQEFWLCLILLVLLIITFVVLIIFYCKLFAKKTIFFKCVVPFICLFLLTFCISFGSIFSAYYKDYFHIKENNPIQIQGKVIGYSVAVSGDDLTVRKSWPIILIEGTNEEITLNVINAEKKLQSDKIYTFLYLPNSKIAEVMNL